MSALLSPHANHYGLCSVRRTSGGQLARCILGCLVVMACGGVAACGGGSSGATVDRAAIGELVSATPIKNQPGRYNLFPCTATVIQSQSGSVIITAGHCVKSFDGTAHTAFSFAPDHTGPTCLNLTACGVNPHGVWTATSSDITIDPGFPGQQRLDVAFLMVHPTSSSQGSVQAAVGGVALEFTVNANGSWTAYGYPHGDALSSPPGAYSTTMQQCAGASSPISDKSDPNYITGAGPLPLQMPCTTQSDGSSGGPWIDSKSGKIGAINKAGGNPAVLADQLGNEVQKLYQGLPTTPAPPTPPSNPFANVNWASASVPNPCASSPATVQLSGSSSQVFDWGVLAISASDVATGDLTLDGQSEAALKYACIIDIGPVQSFSVMVLTGTPGHLTLLDRLPHSGDHVTTAHGTLPLPAEGYNVSLKQAMISNEQLTITGSANFAGVGQLDFTVKYGWDGTHFVVSN